MGLAKNPDPPQNARQQQGSGNTKRDWRVLGKLRGGSVLITNRVVLNWKLFSLVTPLIAFPAPFKLESLGALLHSQIVHGLFVPHFNNLKIQLKPAPMISAGSLLPSTC